LHKNAKTGMKSFAKTVRFRKNGLLIAFLRFWHGKKPRKSKNHCESTLLVLL